MNNMHSSIQEFTCTEQNLELSGEWNNKRAYYDFAFDCVYQSNSWAWEKRKVLQTKDPVKPRIFACSEAIPKHLKSSCEYEYLSQYQFYILNHKI